MKNTLRDMLRSKKAIAMLAGVLAWPLGRWVAGVDASAMTELLIPVVAYIVGQGLADTGKEAAKIQAASAAATMATYAVPAIATVAVAAPPNG